MIVLIVANVRRGMVHPKRLNPTKRFPNILHSGYSKLFIPPATPILITATWSSATWGANYYKLFSCMAVAAKRDVKSEPSLKALPGI